MNKKTTDIIRIFGIKDFIDKRESEANCLLCFTTFSLDEIDEHIESDYHKILHKVTNEIENPNLGESPSKETDLKISGKEKATPIRKDKSNEKLNKNKIPGKRLLQDILESCILLRVNKSTLGFLFNKKIFIDFGSFYLYEVRDSHPYCLRCDKSCDFQHMDDNHDDVDFMSFIVMNVDCEFIREMEPNKYHCGVCNLVKFGWEKMKIHLNSKEHERQRDHSRMLTHMINNNIGDIELIDDITQNLMPMLHALKNQVP